MSYEGPELKRLREEWFTEAAKRGLLETKDLLSRKALHDHVGEVELFRYFTKDDIREFELNVDKDGEFYFTEEQAKIEALMFALMRRYIADFPGGHEPDTSFLYCPLNKEATD